MTISANICRPTLRGVDNRPPENSWFPLWLLNRHMEFRWDEQPDYLFYGDIGNGEQLRYPAETVRIFLTGENNPPNWEETDYALTHERLWNERHWRVPLWRQFYDPDHTVAQRDFTAVKSRVNRFCNFIYSNDRALERIEFFHRLSRYKTVDSGGKVLNNLGGGRIDDKREFISHSKFTIAFENESHPGYATEKIIEPLLMGSIPIYWGDPYIAEDFNPQCMINVHNFPDFDAVIEEVKRINADENLWRKYVEAPLFRDNRIPERLSDQAICEFFRRVFNKPKPQVSRATRLKQMRELKLRDFRESADSKIRRLRQMVKRVVKPS